MELLRTENLCRQFYKDGVMFRAVDHVSFSIEEGECLGLVGESGCGKSTTAGLIARLLKESSGRIVFCGKELTRGIRLRPAGRELQMIFQNPSDSFDPRDTVLGGVMQGAASYGIYTKGELKQKALELFGYTGLKESYAEKRIGELSGGECQRVAVARALMCGPKLLICDEATSALDVLVQAQIISLLKRLKEEKGMSMLFITHDLPLAAALCDRIAVMHQGRIIETGTPQQILNSPCCEQTKILTQAAFALYGQGTEKNICRQ